MVGDGWCLAAAVVFVVSSASTGSSSMSWMSRQWVVVCCAWNHAFAEIHKMDQSSSSSSSTATATPTASIMTMTAKIKTKQNEE